MPDGSSAPGPLPILVPGAQQLDLPRDRGSKVANRLVGLRGHLSSGQSSGTAPRQVKLTCIRKKAMTVDILISKDIDPV